MNIKELLIGFIAGVISALIGASIYVFLFSKGLSLLHYKEMMALGILGKVITIGAIFNIGLFYLFLKFRKDQMAYGVILATAVLAVTTLFL